MGDEKRQCQESRPDTSGFGSSVPAYEMAFSIRNENIHVITSDYDKETLSHRDMRIQGLLDVDGDGEDELIIEKYFSDMDIAITNLEIYKQKSDGNWTRIFKIAGG